MIKLAVLPFIHINFDIHTNTEYYFIYDEDTSDSETNGYLYEIRLSIRDAAIVSILTTCLWFT